MDNKENLLKEFTVSHNWNEVTYKPSSKFILVDNQNRSKLGEGRNFGCGFAFAKREQNNIILVQPISPCKDYLNDVLYSNRTGKNYHAYGLSTKDEGLFKDKKGYLVFSICKQGRELYKYTNYDRDYEMLATNYKNLEKFLNWFEKKLNLDDLTKIKQLEGNKFLAITPEFWTQYTYAISLYSFLIRAGMFYKEGEPLTFLKNFKEDSGTSYMVNNVMPKLEKLMSGNIPKQDLSKLHDVHNMGIMTFNW